LLSVSLIICTRNNPAVLARDALASLYDSGNLDVAAPKGSHLETIVVDQSTDSTTKEVLDSSPFSRDPSARYIHMAQKGLSRARNLAIKEARGDVLAFIDDDIKVLPGHVAKISALFSEHPDIFAMFGPVQADTTVYEEAASAYWNATIPNFTPKEAYKILPGDQAPSYGMGANMAVRREHAVRYFFDPLLGAGARFPSWEDKDFMLRINCVGTLGVFTEPVVLHTGVRKGAEVKQLNEDSARGRAAMLMKFARQRKSLATIGEAILPADYLREALKNFAKTGRPYGLGRLRPYFEALAASLRCPIDQEHGVYFDR